MKTSNMAFFKTSNYQIHRKDKNYLLESKMAFPKHINMSSFLCLGHLCLIQCNNLLKFNLKRKLHKRIHTSSSRRPST